MQTILPVWILRIMSKYSRRKNRVHARRTARLANAVTQALVDSKADALLQGKGNKDILSLLGLFLLSILTRHVLIFCSQSQCFRKLRYSIDRRRNVGPDAVSHPFNQLSMS